MTDPGSAAALAWEETGRRGGETLVLIHSLGHNRSMWRPQVEALADRYRIIAVDLRGHGETRAAPPAETIEQHASDVLAVADTAGVEAFHVCGISIGGMIALWLGVHSADRLLSLIACNTAARIGTVERWDERIAAVRNGGLDSIRESVVAGWFSPAGAGDDPETLAAAYAAFSAASPEGYVACCRVLASTDLTDVVASIEVATLVVGGEHDGSTPPEQSRLLHDQVRGSQLVILPGAGHLSNLDCPEDFTRSVSRFLAGR